MKSFNVMYKKSFVGAGDSRSFPNTGPSADYGVGGRKESVESWANKDLFDSVAEGTLTGFNKK